MESESLGVTFADLIQCPAGSCLGCTDYSYVLRDNLTLDRID